MADSRVAVAESSSPTKQIRNFELNVGGQAVQNQAVVLVDPLDAAKVLTLETDASVPVTVKALPAGLATSALQGTGNTTLASILTTLGALLTELQQKLESGDSVAVSSSALPAGAATSALQGTGNASLGNIDGKLPSLSGGRVPVDMPAGPGTANTPGGQITVGTSTATALAAFAARKGATLYSDPSVNTGKIWVALGSGAANTNFLLNPGDSMALNQGSGAYAGIVTAIADTAGQKLHVVEW